MAQEKILFNGIAIKQPDSGDLESSFETTYTEDSGRPINGVLHITPLFTVESYSYSATNLTLQEMTQILKIIAKGNVFNMRYMSTYYGKWRTDRFYVGKGKFKIGSWKADEERYDSLTFNITGVNPI